MASYQIPQFLDSGEKIFLMMNVRQFAYALFGFFATLIIYLVIQNSVPGIGWYAIIPAIPVILISLYLSMGRYNGRDSEIYVLKLFIYLFKPRIMKYQRQPDYSEVNRKMAELTPEKVLARWNKENNQQTQQNTDQVLIFEAADAKSKADQIRKLSRNLIDGAGENIARLVRRQEIEILHKTETIELANNFKKGKEFIKIKTTPVNISNQNQEFATNFFEEKK